MELFSYAHARGGGNSVSVVYKTGFGAKGSLFLLLSFSAQCGSLSLSLSLSLDFLDSLLNCTTCLLFLFEEKKVWKTILLDRTDAVTISLFYTRKKCACAKKCVLFVVGHRRSPGDRPRNGSKFSCFSLPIFLPQFRRLVGILTG